MSNKIRSDAKNMTPSEFKKRYGKTKTQALKEAGQKPINKKQWANHNIQPTKRIYISWQLQL